MYNVASIPESGMPDLSTPGDVAASVPDTPSAWDSFKAGASNTLGDFANNAGKAAGQTLISKLFGNTPGAPGKAPGESAESKIGAALMKNWPWLVGGAFLIVGGLVFLRRR